MVSFQQSGDIRKEQSMFYIITFILGTFIGMLLTCIVVSGRDK